MNFCLKNDNLFIEKQIYQKETFVNSYNEEENSYINPKVNHEELSNDKFFAYKNRLIRKVPADESFEWKDVRYFL